MNRSCNRLFHFTRRAAIAVGASALFATALPVLAQNVTVIVNGQTMNFDQPPIMRSGRVFVPLRGIFEQLGASVVYANGQINATRGSTTVSLTIGSTAATVNGQSVTVDVAPFVIGARTLVPLRFIAQSLGATVNWNDSNETVTINGGGGGAPPPPAQNRPVVLTYSWPTGTIYNHYPQIRFNLNRPIAQGTLRVTLDGNDVTAGVSNNGQYYFVPAPFSLQMGNHRVRVTGQTPGGLNINLGWTFNQGSY
ncbi:MAG: copper amine oxidase N-terminal domain-containing protein [Candidatus Eremiobacteraeota bacterium]|nr:copper amine oxidase N-terminal domain-containing protein [Candidatus Eremiobacteraeota bacterium]MBV8333213.1 copper amine oxidase N-terminal domain-containing protein [Candidatus Eremiobacteraeota bacterium]MBV8433841.1 copper amine oxidase N-terminal domain-containing protein [Candidatus Eremiobacteraeota bacterium]MBV8654663.1 copper amine oxidase N-terminal domain-containing protein [Candidatus Eremiobacteraeota bacterium]MBV8722849.1 copper amine oxidase N-terminal domain-containing pr